MKAMTLPVSRPEPPPKATMPSWPPARKAAMPASTFESHRVRLNVGEHRDGKPGLLANADRPAGDGELGEARDR